MVDSAPGCPDCAPFRDREAAYPKRIHPVDFGLTNRALATSPAEAGPSSIQRDPTSTLNGMGIYSYIPHHGTFGSRTELTHPTLKVARLLQAAGPVSATFATPFIIRPDPDAAGSFVPRYFKRLAAHDDMDNMDALLAGLSCSFHRDRSRRGSVMPDQLPSTSSKPSTPSSATIKL